MKHDREWKFYYFVFMISGALATAYLLDFLMGNVWWEHIH